jgi:hypothetical protein
MKHLTTLCSVLVAGGIFFQPISSPALAAGASSDYGRTVCQFLKTKAMRAKTEERKAALWAEYKRCLKERGEGW